MIRQRKQRGPSKKALLKKVTIEFFRKHGVANVLRPMTTEQKILLTARIIQIIGKKEFAALLSPEDWEEMFQW
jgi:hypothetical protein